MHTQESRVKLELNPDNYIEGLDKFIEFYVEYFKAHKNLYPYEILLDMAEHVLFKVREY